MSRPQRWRHDPTYHPERLVKHEDGEYVSWDDYKAEADDRERLARLLLLLSGDAQRRFEEIERLKAENTELRKDIAYLKLAERFLVWDEKMKNWRWRLQPPKTKDSFIPPQ